MKHVLKIALVMLVLSPGLQPPGPILRAQAEETCPAIVQAALTSVDELCAGRGCAGDHGRRLFSVAGVDPHGRAHVGVLGRSRVQSLVGIGLAGPQWLGNGVETDYFSPTKNGRNPASPNPSYAG
jgi:hypothetical protein